MVSNCNDAFPFTKYGELKGKVLNSYDKKMEDALKNTELLDLIHILNLDPRKTYDNETIKKLELSTIKPNLDLLRFSIITCIYEIKFIKQI